MLRVFVLLAVVATITACEPKPAGTDTAGATATATTSATVSDAGAYITSPNNGDTLPGPDVTIALSARGVTIEKASGVMLEGVGHHHLFLDTTVTADGSTIPPTTTKIVHIGTGDSVYTFKGLAAGPHEVIAVLAYGDHKPMNVIRDTVRFVVK
jgi:hypothetical protein